MITRRKLVGAMTVGAANLAPAVWSRSEAADSSITFAGWGGTTQDEQKKAWADRFTSETGIKVIQDGPIDLGKLKAQVEAGKVYWDICDIQAPVTVMLGDQGFLEPVDYSVVPEADLDKRFTTKYSVGGFYTSWILGYNKAALRGVVPASWADVFDTKKIPGKRTFYKWMSGAQYEIALLADGVPPDKLYPYDVDRALAKLQTIKKDIVWWSTGAQSQQLLASGEAPIGVFWNNRIYSMNQEGVKDAEIVWKQSTPGTDNLCIPKGSKNKEAAMKFLAIATSAQGQAALANATAVVPINSKAFPLLKPSLLPYMPLGPNETEVKIDVAWQARNWEALSKRWYAWQAGS